MELVKQMALPEEVFPLVYFQALKLEVSRYFAHLRQIIQHFAFNNDSGMVENVPPSF